MQRTILIGLSFCLSFSLSIIADPNLPGDLTALVINSNQSFETPTGTGMFYPSGTAMDWLGTNGGYYSYGASALFRPAVAIPGQVGNQVGAVWTNVNWYAPYFRHGWSGADTQPWLKFEAGESYTLTALFGSRAGVANLQNPRLQFYAREQGVSDTLMTADVEIRPELPESGFVRFYTIVRIPQDSQYGGLGIVVHLTGGIGVSGQYRELLFDDVKLYKGELLPLTGDFNKDFSVDVADLQVMAQSWLDCIIPNMPGCSAPWLD